MKNKNPHSKTMNEEARKYMSEIGRKGGKAASNQAEAGRAAWATMTPAERSIEMKRRAAVREKKRAANCDATVTPSSNPLNNPEQS
jgi:general stress protein YciG